MARLNKRSWQQRIREFLSKPRFSEDSLDDLEDLLLEADIAPPLAVSFSQELRSRALRQKISTEVELLQCLATVLEEALLPSSWQLSLNPNEGQLARDLQVVMLLGVNGVGKTTSLAKLAQHFHNNCGIKLSDITLGAGDTFRAAAAEQLKIHAQRLGVRIVAQERGGDSAAVIYDSVSSALARKQKLVLLDTAGRMHTKKLLIQELSKIDRVLGRLVEPEQRHNILVIDATTGKNAMQQAEAFSEALELRGVILTKLDAQCGGGVAFSLSEKLHLPVLYVGNGEKYQQFQQFEPTLFVKGLLGLLDL